MSRCHVCGSTKAKRKYINEILRIDNKPVLIEKIPAMVCIRCGEETFSRETAERVRRLVHGEAKPVKSVSMKVFTFV